MESPANVLLIEDNPGDADLVKLRLVETHPPVKVDCVPRLADGLEALSSSHPDLVLLDLELPDSHGAETFRRVLEKARNVPVVILSGQDDERPAMKALHNGAQDYLVKGDITSKHLERALRYAMERQALLRSLDMTRKQQQEFRNHFLSHVSHELRTPLTGIHQYVSLVLDGLAGPLSAEQADCLRTALKSVAQLQAMIHDLLEATRAESGKMRIEPRCIAIGEVVAQAIAMMKPAAEQHQITLAQVVDPEIPLVYADPDRILEVFIHLIDNGIKFTPAGGSIEVKATMLETDPSAVYISVTDTGKGISREALPRIFERLYQEGDALHGNRTGLGLGLYLAKEIVTMHGGRMWAVSETGSGSTFSFHLPVYSLARLLGPVITEKGELRPSFVLVRAALKPKTVPPLGNWKEICQQALETMRSSVYADKDLVLPPMTSGGYSEMLYVVASTDMEHAGIMLNRLERRMEQVPQLRKSGTVKLSAEALKDMSLSPEQTIEQKVMAIAERVQGTILWGAREHRRDGTKEHAGHGSISTVH
jgi:sigma-B regulation protein RsbU (phosphoserine phosphatase)